MIAYNLMSIFRLFVLQEKTQKTLSTLRYRTFAIGAYFEKEGCRKIHHSLPVIERSSQAGERLFTWSDSENKGKSF